MSEYKKFLELIEKQNKKIDNLENLIKKLSHEKISPKKGKPIKTRHKKTTVPALLLYFKADNFFGEPKTLNEIVKRFKEESRTVKSTSLTLPLQSLVRSRELGRVLKNGKWHYVSR